MIRECYPDLPQLRELIIGEMDEDGSYSFYYASSLTLAGRCWEKC